MTLLEFLNRRTDGKMPFNPDPSKQAQEVLFSKKATKINHTNIILMVTRYKIVPINSTLV